MTQEVKAFVDSNAKKTYRSAQEMMDYLISRVMEMEKKGEFIIQ